MKILFFIELLYNAAGTERISTDVANKLYEETHWDIKFIVLSNNTQTAFTLNPNIKVESINGNLSSPIRSIQKLRKLIKKETPNYVINVATTMSRISIPAAAFTSTKVITWEHFNLHAGSKLGYSWRIISAYLSYKTIVLTNKDRNDYPKFVHNKITTIYNFPTSMKGYISKIDSNIAITVGRLTFQKGFDMLLNVWKEVKDNGSKWTLYIIGSGEDEKALKAKANNLHIEDSIKFIPNTPNIHEYYQKASLYIMTSRFEGLPLVLIEAKQMGIPCISFDCPNGPSEIIRNNVDGFIIPFKDCKAMSKSILELTSNRNKLKEFSTAALNDINKRFSKDIIIRQWINLLSLVK